MSTPLTEQEIEQLAENKYPLLTAHVGSTFSYLTLRALEIEAYKEGYKANPLHKQFTHFNVADNCDAFHDWLRDNNIEFTPDGHFTSIPFEGNDIFSIGGKWELYKQKNKPKDDGWISVKEVGPPKEHGMFLVWVGDMAIKHYYNGQRWLLQEIFSPSKYYLIEYYMPLPQPPKIK